MSTMTPASSRPAARRRSRWRHPAALVAALALLVGIAAACEPVPPDVDPPWWRLVDRAHTTALGPHVELQWDAAQGSPSSYRIDVNGVTTTIVDPTATRCVMVGLAAGTAYTFKVTAYDAAGNWSGSLGPDGQHDPGYRPAAYTTPPGAGGGPTRRCVPSTDTDGDRLPDIVETGNRIYDHAADTGSLPNDADTDDDGLGDGDEVLGTVDGLDLRAFGVEPQLKDLLVEIDWLTGYTPHPGTGCSAPTNLTPSPASIARAVEAYGDLGAVPPGVGQLPGVNLIVDVGQGGVFDGGGPLADDDGRMPDLAAARDTHMAPERKGYFHYALNSVQVFSIFGGYQEGGLAPKPGDYLGIGQGCSRFSDFDYAATLVHELGHNLDLHHGGHEATGRKPNYNSVMNYRFSFEGLDENCDGRGDFDLIGFSEQVLPSLDENAIDERNGVCGTVPADLDFDGVIDTVPYAADLNANGTRTVLQGSNDLQHLDLAAFTDDDRMGGSELIVDPVPLP